MGGNPDGRDGRGARTDRRKGGQHAKSRQRHRDAKGGGELGGKDGGLGGYFDVRWKYIIVRTDQENPIEAFKTAVIQGRDGETVVESAVK